MTKEVMASQTALKASYLVAMKIAKCKKSHIIAENVLLPAAIEMYYIKNREKAAEALKNILLS